MRRYPYDEFQTVDRPSTSRKIEPLRELSSRAHVPPNSFVDTDGSGSFRGDPDKLIEGRNDE